jgi:hypothetical protein
VQYVESILIFSLIADFSITQESDGYVGKGAEISAGSDRALGRDQRVDSSVEIFHQTFQGREANAGKTSGKGVNSQQHNGPHYLFGEILSGTAGMAEEKVCLKLSALILGNDYRRKISKTCGDPVNTFLLSYPGGYFFRSPLYEGYRSGIQANSVASSGNFIYILKRQGMPVKQNFLCFHSLSSSSGFSLRSFL